MVAALALLGLSLARGRSERAAGQARERREYQRQVLQEIRQTTDEQTRMARLFVLTGNPTYATHFDDLIAIREGRKPRPPHYDKVYWDLVIAYGRSATGGSAESLQSIIAGAGFSVEEAAKLDQLNRGLEQLALLEQIAMNAARGVYRDSGGGFTRRGAPDQAYAARLLHGTEYHQGRGRLMLLLHQTQLLVDQRTQAAVAHADAGLKRLARWEAGVIAAVVLLLAIAFLLLHRRVIEPVEHLAAAAVAVGRNGFFRRVLVEREDELGTLAGALNRMSETVEEKDRECIANEERFRQVLTAVPEALVLTDGEGRITTLNPPAGTLLGGTLAELEGQPLANWLPELGADGLLKRSDAGRDLMLRTADGRKLAVEVTQHSQQRPDGSLLVCTVLRDRSTARADELDRGRQARLQAATLDAIRQPALVTDDAGRITTVNRAFEQVFGLAPGAVTGRTVLELDFLTDAERRQMHADLADAAGSGSRVDRELPVLTRDGFERLHLLSAEGFQAAEGAAGGVVAILADLTDRRRADAELSATRQELARVREEATGLQGAVASAREEVKRLRSEVSGSRTAADGLTLELEQARAQLAGARDMAGAAEARAEALQSELEEANTRMVELAIAQAQGSTDAAPPEAQDDVAGEESETTESSPELRTKSDPIPETESVIDANGAGTEESGEPDWAVESMSVGEPEVAASPAVAAIELAEEPLAEATDGKEAPGSAIIPEEVERGEGAGDAGSASQEVGFTPDQTDVTEPSTGGTHGSSPPPAEAGDAAAGDRPSKRKRAARKKKDAAESQADLFGGYDGAKDEAGPVRASIDPDGVPVVSGLDLREAMSRLELPASDMIQKVVDFAAGLPQAFGDLRAHLAAGDHDAARRQAHSLAGAAGSFSADTLRRLAKTLELALKFDQGDTGRMLAELEHEAARVIDGARQLAGLSPGNPAPDRVTPAGSRKLLTILEELSAALDQGEIEAIGQAVGKLKSGNLPEDLRANYERLSEMIDSFEYAEAAGLVREMMEQAR